LSFNPFAGAKQLVYILFQLCYYGYMSKLPNTSNISEDTQDLLLGKVSENWVKVKNLVNHIEDEKVKAGCIALTDHLYDRMAVCPASTRTEFVGCFVGGLTWHSLNVLRVMKTLHTAFELEEQVDADSMIVLGLFHDIGKLGNDDTDYYIPQKSEWHREKLGQLYEINEGMGNIPVSSRSLWWLNHFQVPLTENEIHAIQSLTSKQEQISFTPGLNDPWETFLLQSAVRGACIKHHGVIRLP